MNSTISFVHGLTPDWSVREHQPMRLGILAALSTIMEDKDTTLFDALQAGVSTGFQKDIPPSQCFPINDRQVGTSTLLSAHMCNWASAESDLELTRSLVEEEISRGWVYKFDGDLSDAQAAFPTGVAIGKLGVATSDTRPPRLVVDNSVCGLNARCHIPERSTLPTAKDVLRSFPIRGCADDIMAMSLDIKSAHKCVVLRESERGLVGFSFNGELYFYRVAPFGASFSAAWWSCVGGYVLRLMHHIIWIPHCGLVFVDDYLFYQIKTMMPVTAALLCILVLCCRIPISWKKLELASTISWIGWRFHFSGGFVELPMSKMDKIQRYLKQLSQSSRTTRKDLEKFIGILMWVTQLFLYMRIWLHYFYKDLYAIPATHFSIDRDNWDYVAPCLTADLIFHKRPPDTAIPVQGKLISVRHQSVASLEDLSRLRLSDRCIWMRIRDPNSNKRTLSSDTMRMVSLYQSWFLHLQPLRPMRPKQFWTGEVAADACAAGPSTQIGGFIRAENGDCRWFSEKYSHEDFTNLKIDLDPDLQKSITCMETLAQLGILHLAARHFHATRMPIKLSSRSDNTGAEASTNKLFCTIANPFATSWNAYAYSQRFPVLKWMYIIFLVMQIKKQTTFPVWMLKLSVPRVSICQTEYACHCLNFGWIVHHLA